MKSTSSLFPRLLFCVGIFAFCGQSFQAEGKQEAPQPEPQRTNSLGMKFVPVP